MDVGRLNLFILCKCRSFTNIKVNSMHATTCQKSCTVLSETGVVDKSAYESRSPTGMCRANFCYTISKFYLTLLNALHT